MQHARRSAVAVAVVLLGPAAAAAAGNPQSRRLRVVNGCQDHPIWVAHTVGATVGPDPQNVAIPPMGHYDFLTSDGLSATRFWPKMFCDVQGNNCGIGESGGPGQGCVVRTPAGWDDYSKCAPPVDTKFEASFGVNGEPCNPKTPGGTEMKGCDYVDLSLVDGFTLPVKLQIQGSCTDSRRDSPVDTIDCSELTAQACPTAENLAAANSILSLHAVNPATKQFSGCYSPCQRLLDTKWTGDAMRLVEAPEVAPYCCPTPPVHPDECRRGPIISTQFLQTVQQKCRGAYSYAYDDSNGLLRCSASTVYTLTFFCPSTAQERQTTVLNVEVNSTDTPVLPSRGFLSSTKP